jgi:Metallopeptidase family M24/Creatinase/Prolidase N-terminal domain
MNDVILREIELPDFGTPFVEPDIPAGVYRDRIRRALAAAETRGLDVLVVYADREHSANIAYLTGFEPRFEEAMLVLSVARSRPPALVVGNEGWGYVDISPVASDLRRVLFQSFSLLAQPRGDSPSIRQLLKSEGVGRGSRVGVAGWKYFTALESDSPGTCLEIPSYLADALREETGDPKLVTNETAIFMNAADGLRVLNEAEQLAQFERAAAHTSTAVRRVLFGLRPGMTEREAVGLMGLNGTPLSCHLMLSSGPRATMGLPSPSSRRIEEGDRFTTAYGVWGALNCRAGFVVRDENGLPPGIRDYVDKLVAPYFRAIVAWYETLRIGARGGELYRAVHRHIGDPFFGVKLNPGHQIHLDEWVNSPVFEGSAIELRSGMAFQVDVIPATGTEYFTTNIEDGIALADEALRAEIESRFPESWSRIVARRDFMKSALGIELAPEVLPFSNIPAYLAPFLLSPRRAMTVQDGTNGGTT